MNPEVFRAVSTGNLSFFDKDLDVNLLEVTRTPEENTVLHVALQFNQIEVAKKIVSLCPSLVSKKNSKDNTPLHVASRAGTSLIVKRLMDEANKEDVEASGTQQHLLSMVNEHRDTALHVAVRYCNFDVVKELINEKDPAELVNKAGESALFLAVERQRYDIASHILEKAPNCSCAGRDGMNVLHALAFRKSNRPEVIFGRGSLITISLNILKESLDSSNYIPKGFMKAVTQKSPSAIEKRDNFGWTPLEIAAFTGNEKFVKLLLEVALEMDPPKSNIAYSKDNEGSSALHFAARKGNVRVMKELINIFPDIYELLDNMGRNALHVAAESGRIAAVNFFLDRPEFNGLINEQDKEGNTPLHLAAIGKRFKIASQLLENDKGVDLNSTNNDGLTTMDKLMSPGFWLTRVLRVKLKDAQQSLRGVLFLKAMPDDSLNDPTMKAALADPEVPADESISESKADGVKKSDTKAESMMDSDSKAHGMKNSDTKAESMMDSNTKADVMKNSNSKADSMKNSDSKKDSIMTMANTNIVVATLITAVTFTAAFTVPGGYRSQGVDEGKAVLSKIQAFRVFQVANTCAFGISIYSVFLNYVVMTSLKGLFQSEDYEQRAYTCTTYSILLLAIAFVSGTYAVVPHSMGMTLVFTFCCCFYIWVILSLLDWVLCLLLLLSAWVDE